MDVTAYTQSITLADAAQVFFHLTVRRQDERILETTRLSEDGVEGSGIPKAFMLGKGQKMPRGWEIALYGEHQDSPRSMRTHLSREALLASAHTETS